MPQGEEGSVGPHSGCFRFSDPGFSSEWSAPLRFRRPRFEAARPHRVHTTSFDWLRFCTRIRLVPSRVNHRHDAKMEETGVGGTDGRICGGGDVHLLEQVEDLETTSTTRFRCEVGTGARTEIGRGVPGTFQATNRAPSGGRR